MFSIPFHRVSSKVGTLPERKGHGITIAPAGLSLTRQTQVSIGELLTTVRGGFKIYKCYLQGSSPRKGPDHEVRGCFRAKKGTEIRSY